MAPSGFRERIRKSLSNEALQMALDANTERRVSGRVLAFESIPDWRDAGAPMPSGLRSSSSWMIIWHNLLPGMKRME